MIKNRNSSFFAVQESVLDRKMLGEIKGVLLNDMLSRKEKHDFFDVILESFTKHTPDFEKRKFDIEVMYYELITSVSEHLSFWGKPKKFRTADEYIESCKKGKFSLNHIPMKLTYEQYKDICSSNGIALQSVPQELRDAVL